MFIITSLKPSHARTNANKHSGKRLEVFEENSENEDDEEDDGGGSKDVRC